jgi:peptidoglycan/LPS O-acetylase OafA/YrhL
MPSSSARSRATTRRSPRSAPAAAPAATRPAERPLEAVLATVFGVLVAAEDAYLAWLMWTPQVGWDWFMVVPLLLAVAALAGALAVFRGRRRGWLLLAVAAGLLLAVLLVLGVLFAILGGGTAMWSAVALLIGPVGCLILALRRPVRLWTSPRRAGRSAGGRRGGGSSR